MSANSIQINVLGELNEERREFRSIYGIDLLLSELLTQESRRVRLPPDDEPIFFLSRMFVVIDVADVLGFHAWWREHGQERTWSSPQSLPRVEEVDGMSFMLIPKVERGPYDLFAGRQYDWAFTELSLSPTKRPFRDPITAQWIPKP